MKRIGLICVALALVISRFIILDIGIIDIVLGLLLGIGLSFLIIALLPESARDKIKNAKKSFLHRS
jgi:uncharacterized membrane protein YgaE (UPF0421/DUF939 family)